MIARMLRKIVKQPGTHAGEVSTAASCSLANLNENREVWRESPYYEDAERFMRAQWDVHIWPLIRDADFAGVLDLAAGCGRNSELLKEIAGQLWIVDINQTNIDRCKARFAGHAGPCLIHYAVNDGVSLPMVPTRSLSFVYSFDAMVHFDPGIIRQYVAEFARIMKPGATGFCHHSNYGAWAPDPSSHWQHNPHWRSHMTAGLFESFCRESNLELTRQVIHSWGETKDLDCFSCFRKPA